MATARVSQTATLLRDGRVLVTGGQSSSAEALATAELYDPRTGSWAATGSMMEARSFQTATLLPDGRVLVAGGRGSSPGALSSAELYDPRTGSWTPTGSVIAGRYSHTATSLPDGRVLVAGGYYGSNFFTPRVLASAELYDPTSSSWTSAANMIEGRASHTATLLPDGRVLLAGGFNGNDYLASAELYDPSSRSWTAAASMIERRAAHTATLLPDGTVLLAGGITNERLEVIASVELYDPSSRSWTATGRMIAARAFQTAMLLPDGRVLMTGGSNGIGSPLASAERYDPRRGSPSATSNMITQRTKATATLLPDGRVLVAGGTSSGLRASALALAELYDPASRSTQPSSSQDTSARCELTPDASPDATIQIIDRTFGAAVTVDAGEAVEFRNEDNATHTVTEGVGGHAAGNACARQKLPPSENTVVTFYLPGDYQFTCTIHGRMQTEVHVR